MALNMLSRKPDSGLGNIKASPGSPSRNIDWILVLTQGALAIIGLFTIYSASYSKFANPFLYVTRQEIFLIGAVITMIVPARASLANATLVPAEAGCAAARRME